MCRCVGWTALGRTKLDGTRRNLKAQAGELRIEKDVIKAENKVSEEIAAKQSDSKVTQITEHS